MSGMSENVLPSEHILGTPISAASDKPLPALPFRNLENKGTLRSKQRTRSEDKIYSPVEDARDAKFLVPRRPPLPPLNTINAGRIWQTRMRSTSPPQGRMLVELPATEVGRPRSTHSNGEDNGSLKPPPSDATDDILGLYENHSDRSDEILDWEREAIGKRDMKPQVDVSGVTAKPTLTTLRLERDREGTFETMSDLERGLSRSHKKGGGQHYVDWVAAERRKEEMRIQESLWRAKRKKKTRVAMMVLFGVLVVALICMAVGFLAVKK